MSEPVPRNRAERRAYERKFGRPHPGMKPTAVVGPMVTVSVNAVPDESKMIVGPNYVRALAASRRCRACGHRGLRVIPGGFECSSCGQAQR